MVLSRSTALYRDVKRQTIRRGKREKDQSLGGVFSSSICESTVRTMHGGRKDKSLPPLEHIIPFIVLCVSGLFRG